MKHRKLRIAWSAFCGLAAVLLVALWVRSYWIGDGIYLTSSGRQANVFSLLGTISTNIYPRINQQPKWEWTSQRISQMMPVLGWRRSWYYRSDNQLTHIVFPHRLLVLLFAVFAIMPWLRWSKRFTVRDLLIVTTLVAVFIGLIAYAARS